MRIGDVLTITLERKILVLKVQQLGTRRGPFVEAQTLYEDLSPKPVPREEGVEGAVPQRDSGAGRPTKRERRQMDAFRKVD